MTPKIAYLAASAETQAALRSWALRHGFDLTRTHGGRKIPEDQFTFHVTLLATENPISAPETDHVIPPIEVDAIGFDALGPDRNTPVLKLQAVAALAMAREFFVSTYGADPTFADFKPHVSLSYAWSGVPNLGVLDLPTFPLHFDRLSSKSSSRSRRRRCFRGARRVRTWSTDERRSRALRSPRPCG